MAKKKVEEKETKEIVKEEKKEKELSPKEQRKLEIIQEREKYEEIIDKLIDEKYEAKKNKDKNKVRELNKKIKENKKQRSLVGATDSFGGQVRAEMALVRWPSALEVTKYTIAVLVFVLFFAGFFFLINFLFSLFTGMLG